MIIDTHTTIPKPGTPRAKLNKVYEKSTEEGLLTRMNALAVDKAVVWYIGRDSHETVVHNDWVESLVERHPDRFIGFFCVYPLDRQEALKEFGRCIGKPVFKGLKMHPRAQNFKMSDPSVLGILKEAKDHDLPVVLHVTTAAYEPHTPAEAVEVQRQRDESERGYNAASKFLLDIIRTYNSRNLIAAHMGGLYTPEIQNSEITFQTTGACVEAVEYACDHVGAERIIFGSDFPFFEVFDELAKIEKAKIPLSAKEKILGDNAKALRLT